MNSIDAVRPKTKKRAPIVHSSKLTFKNKTNDSNETGSFFSELGIRSEQFKSLFDNLPQGVALYKMVYDTKTCL